MAFDGVLNQTIPKRILRGALRRNLLSSSYLFYGDQGTGKWAMALELAKAINCEENQEDPCDHCPSCQKIDRMNHPDVKMIFPLPSFKSETKSRKEIEKKRQAEIERYHKLKREDTYCIVKFEKNVNIAVEDIREMRSAISLKPFEAKRKVIIIADAENMHVSSANSLLKTVEEPPADATLILTAVDVNKLLPTVVSRCQQIRFGKIPKKVIEEKLMSAYGIDEEKASYCANLSLGSYGKALDFLRGEKQDIRQEALDLLQVATEGNTVQIIRKVNQLVDGWDRNSIMEMFDFLLSVLRDIYVTLEGFNQLINSDMKSLVVKLREKFKRQNKVEDAFRTIDQIRVDCLTRNASLKLALLSMCLKVKAMTND